MLERQELTTRQSADVREISSGEFKRLLERAETNIETDDWVDVTLKDIVANVGAGPCLIVWVYDKESGKMTKSGHFSEVSQTGQNEFIKEEIKRAENYYKEEDPNIIEVPNARHVIEFNRLAYDLSYEDFEEFLREISTDIQKTSRDNIEVLLFGHNLGIFGDKNSPADLVRFASEHVEVISCLRDIAGISESNIRDYRVIGANNVDSTIYVAAENTVFHYRRLSGNTK